MGPLDERRLSEQHHRVWRAIDRLARGSGFSPSGLARAAGLDPTALNPSKRIGRDGKLRWPGVETLSKIAAAADVSLRDVARLIEQPIDAIGVLAAPLSEARFDAAGRPIGASWAPLAPAARALDDPALIAVAIEDDAADPIFRRGDMVYASTADAARPADRVLAAPLDGPPRLAEVTRVEADTIALRSLNGAAAETSRAAYALIAPILWTRPARR